MATLNNANRPDVRAYIGATGSGKGVSIREHLKAMKPARLMVWDPLGEYGKFAKTVHTAQALAAAVAGAGERGFKVAYTMKDRELKPGQKARTAKQIEDDQKRAFALFCALAIRTGNLTVLVEELSDVTQPSYAPPAWRRISLMGRHSGLSVIAATQRPALVDKAFLGNATYIRCFTLREETDQRRMASVLGVGLDVIAGLSTVESAGSTRITFYERDFRTGECGEGAINLRR